MEVLVIEIVLFELWFFGCNRFKDLWDFKSYFDDVIWVKMREWVVLGLMFVDFWWFSCGGYGRFVFCVVNVELYVLSIYFSFGMVWLWLLGYCLIFLICFLLKLCLNLKGKFYGIS